MWYLVLYYAIINKIELTMFVRYMYILAERFVSSGYICIASL